jgi:hypothetical protein
LLRIVDGKEPLKVIQNFRINIKKCLLYTKKSIVVLGEIIYGMTIYEMVRDLRKERSHLEHMFILTVFGDLLGIPILPPYFSLRLLPYVVPSIRAWQISMLRERDITDLCDQEIT